MGSLIIKATRLDSLDLLRGIAAFLVLSGHLRSYIFKSYYELAQVSLLDKTFYFITGLGHQSVIIFFALSGFLVGGKVLEDILNGRFFWAHYCLRRLTRLLIVVIPALILTLLFDGVGIQLTHGAGYHGEYHGIYNSGPQNSAGVDHSLLTFLGNIMFLQTIYVPTFGSNGPLWSLANEFWYYVTFPLAFWVGFARPTALVRIAVICILFLIIIVLPIWLLVDGIIWVAGAAAAWCTYRKKFAKIVRHSTTRISTLSLLFTALVLTKISPNEIGDLGLGIAIAFTLPVVATLPSFRGLYSTLARASSELSYTLYLTHFPLLTVIIMVGLAPDKMPPSLFAAVLYIALLSVAITWAAVIWWCFERNTNRVYSLVSSTLLARTKTRAKTELYG